ALVREKARIDEVVRDYVALKPAGGGSLKGLCPFHDERSPSFHVTPSRGMYYCFGCQEGGDVISFVQKLDHLTFAESVEKLAGRTGVTLRYVEGGAGVHRQQGQRTRLVEANKAAADFFTERLTSPEAVVGRQFLTERGFDAAVAADFGIGFAPKSWDALTSHLRQRGFTDAELTASGLVSQGSRGIYDRFRGRLVWPIRDLAGDVVGFGARRLLEDDDGPKYLNTPETPLYKKSQVLYGIDRARREISKQQQVVVVEGYTDVMACHLAGVTTAVATCGTAFGSDHIKVLRRLLMDDDTMRGEVVFTFDGDEAGRRAALKAFDDDQRFVAQTFVAVEAHGLDPCDLRQQHGDVSVRDLVQHRVPLFEFAIRSTLALHDLETAEGRVAALREAAPIVARIKDPALRPEYVRRLAGWLGLDVATVTRAVGGKGASAGEPARRPDARDPEIAVQREALKCALQEPGLCATWYSSVEPGAYTDDGLRAVHEAIAAAGGPRAEVAGLAWIDAVLRACPDDEIRSRVRALTVEPLPVSGGVDARFATAVLARLLEMDAARRVTDLRGQMQRMEEGSPEQGKAFADLMALEAYRRDLREKHGE
ncbi:MAG: DNA primase, partial [Candidatus Nanopelagicales bacterium]